MGLYFAEWDENTDIGWWRDGRMKLNVIIRMVNEWTILGRPKEKKEKLLRYIDKGIQTFAAQDGGEEWRKTLLSMKEYVSR